VLIDSDLGQATVVFDLDGTLVDTAPDLAAATNHALATLGLAPLSVAALRPYIGHGSKAMIAAGLRLADTLVGEHQLKELHEHFLDFYAGNVAVASRPYEGIPELLAALTAAGARLAVCTNKLEGLSKLLLSELALADKFSAIAGRDTFPEYKPAAGHLLGAIALAGGHKERAVMVGDSEVDFATAEAAGIPAIGVTFGYTLMPVRDLVERFTIAAVIDHYREFPSALARALPRP
jgi:phosphoglycolate phosphatase